MRLLAACVVFGICLAATCMLWPTLVSTSAGKLFFIMHDRSVSAPVVPVLRAAIVAMWAIAVVAISFPLVRRAQK